MTEDSVAIGEMTQARDLLSALTLPDTAKYVGLTLYPAPADASDIAACLPADRRRLPVLRAFCALSLVRVGARSRTRTRRAQEGGVGEFISQKTARWASTRRLLERPSPSAPEEAARPPGQSRP